MTNAGSGPRRLWRLCSLSNLARYATFAAAFAALERCHHEEDVIGSRCGRDFGRFRSLAWCSAHLSRTRRLSVLVGLCRCPGWTADPPLLLAYPALLGWLCLERAPSAHLRLIRSRLFRCLDRALSRDVYLVLDDFGGHRINSQQKRFHQQAES